MMARRADSDVKQCTSEKSRPTYLVELVGSWVGGVHYLHESLIGRDGEGRRSVRKPVDEGWAS